MLSVITALTLALAGTGIALAEQSGSPSTTGHAPEASTSALPLIPTCRSSGVFMPGQLQWCTSACSSYVRGIAWTSWTTKSAIGIGTLMTNNGVPSCAGGTWTAHRNFHVIWSNPEPYCIQGNKVAGYDFLDTNIWGGGAFEGIHRAPGCGD
jgi:hypothetical protein